jgi:hydrogenase-4 component B
MIANAVSSQFSFFASLLLFACGAAGSLVLRKNDAAAHFCGNGFAIAGSIVGLIASLLVLIFDSSFACGWKSSLPLLSFNFNVDPLSAFFIFIISLISLFASLYAIGYVGHFYKKYDVGVLGFFYNVFIAGMMMVVSADHLLFFLIVWEVMSLSSYFLVTYENREKENVKAGSVYFVMTHIGTAFIMLSFLLLYQAAGSLDFSVIKENIVHIRPIIKNMAFGLALVGFGTKAGMIPFHIWLPGAHPAAPTHVSALMSGVMIKTGIYMFIRIFVDMMPDGPVWWGMVILTAGAISSLLGVLYALTEHDIKRLLAYHSIENVGIILLGLGSALIFLALGMKPLAVLGLVAALFHTINHAIFKALLFFGAGAVISETHTRNMESYGGLIKRMPQTAFFFLVGAMAISALPPFNGFISEWLTFQSLFAGIRSLDRSVQGVFLLGVGVLAFTGGLAAACFVKVFGATFLARARSEEARHAGEVALSLRTGMAALAVLSLLFGLFSGMVVQLLSEVVHSLSVFNAMETAFTASAGLFTFHDHFASVSLPLIFASLVSVTAAVWLLVRILTKNRKVRLGCTWDCGAPLTSRMEITATGFSRSIITVFRGILQPTQQYQVEYMDAEIRYFTKANRIRLEIRDIYSSYFYSPLQDLVAKVSVYVKQIQGGNINIYVLYIFFILIALLLLVV